MKLPHEAELLRIFIGESDKDDGRPLYEAIVKKARLNGMAGITVLRGILGFGAHSHIHSAKILRMSEDLPIVIEIVDKPERIVKILPQFPSQFIRRIDYICGNFVLHLRFFLSIYAVCDCTVFKSINDSISPDFTASIMRGSPSSNRSATQRAFVNPPNRFSIFDTSLSIAAFNWRDPPSMRWGLQTYWPQATSSTARSRSGIPSPWRALVGITGTPNSFDSRRTSISS